jgi:hypothetical protein
MVGSGLSVNQINQKLKPYGYYLPINNLDKDRRIFDLINKDNAIIDDSNYESIRDLVRNLWITLPNGDSI